MEQDTFYSVLLDVNAIIGVSNLTYDNFIEKLT